MTTQKKDIVRNVGHWAIFLVAALTLTIKILEVSASNTLDIVVQNPEISQYSRLVQTGYLFER
jgi:hypothetical protein